MSINETDKFIVNRSNSSFYVEQKNLMASLQDTDLMLVNRSDNSYKITGAELKESLTTPQEILQPKVIAPPDGAGFSNETYTPKTSPVNNVAGLTPKNYTSTLKKETGTNISNAENAFDGDFTNWATTSNSNISFTWDASPYNISSGRVVVITPSTRSGCLWYLVDDNNPEGSPRESVQINDISGCCAYDLGDCTNLKRLYGTPTPTNNLLVGIMIDGQLLVEDNTTDIQRKLTFDNAYTYINETGDTRGQPISESFTAGQTVTGVKVGSPTAAGMVVADAVDNTMLVQFLTESIFTSASAAEVAAWRDIAYGDGKFVAVANDGTAQVMYSEDDGLTWKNNVTGVEVASWLGITYGNGKFVAVAYDGKAMYSTDGINWTSATVSSEWWRAVAYGNGKFVAVGGDDTATNRVMWADENDLSTWTLASAASETSWISVTYGVPSTGEYATQGKALFVAVAFGTTGNISMYSDDDGLTWKSGTGAVNQTWQSVTYGNGKFVAVSLDGTEQVMYSTDGISWTSAQTPATQTDNTWRSVTYANGKFVAVGNAASGTELVMWADENDLDT